MSTSFGTTIVNSFFALPWPMFATFIGLCTLGVILWVNFVRPWRRGRLLKSPCEVHFVLRPEYQGHNYVIHDAERHHVKELVLPANATIELEIGIHPKIGFRETETVFGCDDEDTAGKPRATHLIDSFTEVGGKTSWAPGEDEGHYIDIGKFYHRRQIRSRNVGTHYVTSYKLETGKPGIYKTYLSFLTEELEGNAELSIRVEEKPRTRMRCIRHKDCYVKPRVIEI